MQVILVKTQAQGLSRGLVNHGDMTVFIDGDDAFSNRTQNRTSLLEHASDLMGLQPENCTLETAGQ